eukprot:PhF_6_TR990/c0_g1_i3/m.1940
MHGRRKFHHTQVSIVRLPLSSSLPMDIPPPPISKDNNTPFVGRKISMLRVVAFVILYVTRIRRKVIKARRAAMVRSWGLAQPSIPESLTNAQSTSSTSELDTNATIASYAHNACRARKKVNSISKSLRDVIGQSTAMLNQLRHSTPRGVVVFPKKPPVPRRPQTQPQTARAPRAIEYIEPEHPLHKAFSTQTLRNSYQQLGKEKGTTSSTLMASTLREIREKGVGWLATKQQGAGGGIVGHFPTPPSTAAGALNMTNRTEEEDPSMVMMETEPKTGRPTSSSHEILGEYLHPSSLIKKVSPPPPPSLTTRVESGTHFVVRPPGPNTSSTTVNNNHLQMKHAYLRPNEFREIPFEAAVGHPFLGYTVGDMTKATAPDPHRSHSLIQAYPKESVHMPHLKFPDPRNVEKLDPDTVVDHKDFFTKFREASLRQSLRSQEALKRNVEKRKDVIPQWRAALLSADFSLPRRVIQQNVTSYISTFVKRETENTLCLKRSSWFKDFEVRILEVCDDDN